MLGGGETCLLNAYSGGKLGLGDSVADGEWKQWIGMEQS